jgi:hypothetical protein
MTNVCFQGQGGHSQNARNFRSVARIKAKLCDDGHIAFAQSSLLSQIEGSAQQYARSYGYLTQWGDNEPSYPRGR